MHAFDVFCGLQLGNTYMPHKYIYIYVVEIKSLVSMELIKEIINHIYMCVYDFLLDGDRK